MAWPTKLPRWATSGSTLEPSEGKKDLGWVGGGEKPPYRTFNWLLKTIYDNLAELRRRDEAYTTLDTLVADTAVGDVATVAGYDFGDYFPLVDSQAVASSGVAAIDCDGEYVYVAGGTGFVERRSRDDLSTQDVDYAANLSGTPTSFVGIASDGTHVAVGYVTAGNDLVDVFNATTGALVGTFDCGADTINTIRMMRGYTYVAYGDNVSRLLNTAPSAAPITYDHSAVVTSVQVTRDKVIVVGAGRTTNDGNASIGDDVVGCGFNLSIIWGKSLTNGPNSDNVDTIDGEFAYLFDNAASPSEVAVVSIYGGDFPPGISDTYQFGAGVALTMFPEGVACDPRWLYIADAGGLYAYDKRTLCRVAQLSSSANTAGVVCCDGDRVFAFLHTGGPTYTIVSYQCPNTELRYQRVDPAADDIPYQLKALQVGA